MELCGSTQTGRAWLGQAAAQTHGLREGRGAGKWPQGGEGELENGLREGRGSWKRTP